MRNDPVAVGFISGSREGSSEDSGHLGMSGSWFRGLLARSFEQPFLT